jgi:arylformamidase
MKTNIFFTTILTLTLATACSVREDLPPQSPVLPEQTSDIDAAADANSVPAASNDTGTESNTKPETTPIDHETPSDPSDTSSDPVAPPSEEPLPIADEIKPTEPNIEPVGNNNEKPITPVTQTLDITYRSDVNSAYAAQTKLDIHYSDNNKTKPVFLFFHGGGWISGDKAEAVNTDVSQFGEFVRDNGFLLVSANYRLVDIEAVKQGLPSPTYRDQASDIAHAIAWVKKNIATYGGDPENLVVAGHSAGAHLVPLVALDPRYLAEVNLTSSAITKVISFDVHAYHIPNAISLMSANPDFISKIPSLKMMFGQTTSEQLEASPAHYIAAINTAPRFLILSAGTIRGTIQDLTKKASQDFVDRLTSAGFSASHSSFDLETHSSLVSDLNTAGDQPAAVVREFLASSGTM